MRVEGGNRLITKLEHILKEFSDCSVNVGFLENATYPDGIHVAAIAYQNEFGRPESGQPPRPYFRRMIAQYSGHWPVRLAAAIKASNYDANIAFTFMGEEIRGQLQQSINELTDPKLAPSTVEAKGHPKPLIETSHMLNSVDYEVKT